MQSRFRRDKHLSYPITVWVNGTFDVLHAGHIKLFRHAKMLAGVDGKVICGIDVDERISSKKGPSRPINTLTDRMLVLMSIKHIDQVIPFATDQQLSSIIASYTPDYMVIGDDYRDKPIIGSEFIKEIIYVERDDNSSTRIINKLDLD